jgi:hypothetical protein
MHPERRSRPQRQIVLSAHPRHHHDVTRAKANRRSVIDGVQTIALQHYDQLEPLVGDLMPAMPWNDEHLFINGTKAAAEGFDRIEGVSHGKINPSQNLSRRANDNHLR